jgi:inosose dehydratase
LCDELERRDLTAVGSFVFEDFHDPAQADDVVAVARRACAAIAAAGGSVLVIIDRVSPVRAATAGRSDAAERLSGQEWQSMLMRVGAAAEIARDHGLRPVFHPHVGSYVEFEDEIERLLEDTDLDLCLDTGHSAYAGMTAERAIEAYASRLRHLHLKDVRPGVLARIANEGLDFWAAIAAGVFCPMGEGVVRVPSVLAALSEGSYDDSATIEQDRVPGSGAPLDDLRRSVAVVRAAAPA